MTAPGSGFGRGYLHGAFAGACLTIFATIMGNAILTPKATPTLLLPSEQSFFIQPTVPLRANITILTDAQFDRQPYVFLRQHSEDVNIVAFTNANVSPCEITLRAGMEIEAWPERRRAQFVDREDGDTIAHELLHCIRDWHQ